MLDKTIVPLQFRGGIDTKSDDKTVVPGKLLVLENATFTNPGRLNKRFGYRAMSREVENPHAGVPAKLEVGRGLVAYKDELLTFDGRNTYSWSESSDSWLWKGVMPSCSVSEDAVSNSTQSASMPDGAIHSSGMQAFVWLDADGVRYTIIDATTGQRVVASKLLAAGANNLPKVVVLGNNFLFYYQDAIGNLKLGQLSVADPTATVAFSDIITYSTDSKDSVKKKTANLSYRGAVYDVCVMTHGVYLTFINTQNETGYFQNGGITTKRYSTTNPMNLLGNAYIEAVDQKYHQAVSLFEDLYLNAPVVVESHRDNTGKYAKYVAYGPDLSGGPLSTGTVGTSFVFQAVEGYISVSGVSLSADRRDWVFYNTFNVMPFFFDNPPFTAGGPYIEERRVSGAFVIGPVKYLLTNCVLLAKPVRVGDTAYLAVMNAPARKSADTQPFDRSVFVFNTSGAVVARLSPSADRGDGLEYQGNTSSLVVDPDGAVVFPYLVPPQTDGGTLLADATLGVVTGRVRPDAQLAGSAQVSDSIHFGGGILWQYDGISPVELGFLTPANSPALRTVAAGGPDIYSYVVVPEWVDAQGYRHLGAPSVPAKIGLQTDGVPGTSKPVVGLTPMNVTMKRPDATVPRAPVMLGLYRTLKNGEEYYLVKKFENLTNNYTLPDYFDTMSDTTLVGQPTLYTTGGVIENGTPPATDHITTHRNRLFAVDSANRLLLHYSKSVGPGVPVEFSPDFTLQVDPTGGDITAIASMDDKLVVFKRSSVYALTGQGPDDLGQMNDLAGATLVTTDSGCVNARSIVMTPHGLIFQSAKGFRLLSRDLSVSDIGADVYGYKDDRVTGGVLCEGVSQIRLTLASGVALVYDYDAQQWSVFTPMPAVGAALWRGAFSYLRGDGTVLVEDPARFDDNGSFIRMRLKTAWLQFAQMQGFQRIYKLLALGSFKSAHKLRVKLAYDFNPTPVQTLEVEPTSVGTYGTETYGEGTFGGAFPLYQWRINPARQKCEAMQVTIEDAIDPAEGAGESMSLTGITLEVGLKRGTNKMGSGNTAR